MIENRYIFNTNPLNIFQVIVFVESIIDFDFNAWTDNIWNNINTFFLK